MFALPRTVSRSRAPRTDHSASSRRSLLLAGLGTLIAGGLAVRIWLLSLPLGALDSDEAVFGLIARHLVGGEISVMYWGQAYVGTHESFAAAPLFAVFGSSHAALRAVPFILHAAAAILVFRIGLRTVGRHAALFGATLFWIFPGGFVWWSTRVRGYEAPLVLGLAAVLIALNTDDEPTRRRIALLGLLVGVGWWASPQSAYLTIPALAWLVWRHRFGVLRPALVLTALAGASPWLVYNAVNDWPFFRTTPQPEPNGFLDHIGWFFDPMLPMALGMKVPFSHRWIGTGIGIGVYVLLVLALVTMAVATWRTASSKLPLVGRVAPQLPAPAQVLALTLAVYPFLYATSPLGWYRLEPRYLFFLAPAASLLIAVAIVRVTRKPLEQLAVLFVALVLTMGTVVSMNRTVRATTQPDVSTVVHRLVARDINQVFADYWTAYRISFASNERVIATPLGSVRYRTHDELVRGAERPAYVAPTGSDLDLRLAEAFAARDVVYERSVVGGYATYVPGRRVLPEELPLGG